MSDYQIRTLAAACAPRIAAQVELVVMETVRRELPGVLEAVLREHFPGETLRLYVPKKSVSARRIRDDAIRAQYNGHNSESLARTHGITARQVRNIAGVRATPRKSSP